MSNQTKRFGDKPVSEIDQQIKKNIPVNTKKSRDSVWNQFSKFLDEKNYKLDRTTSLFEINNILKSWAANMKKQDGSSYKEGVLKQMWNVTAKMVQEMFFNKWNIQFNPFTDLVFKTARDTRDVMRKTLQALPEKRKRSAASLTEKECSTLTTKFNEETPDGLQKKFFMVASYELAWRGGEGARCLTHFFNEELDNTGTPTGRIEYNPIFSKTAQGGAKPLTESKWLIPNTTQSAVCPVRLYHLLVKKRGDNITTDRFFLTPNPYWTNTECSNWYKNSPVGINEITKWVKHAAEETGLDIKRRKITNHSLRSSAVSNLAKSGVGENQLLKITGHSSVSSIKSYLQLDSNHHTSIVEKMRENRDVAHNNETNRIVVHDSNSSISSSGALVQNCKTVNFSNCTFYSSNCNK
ncbi:uncharacterized protein LOC116164086 [Photinus pyralis]|uniref:uncharacterized protein LOC116164086 n=1 Tax=Photinus pyralis TaxID=7054 RepID=UPI001267360F|nr:uncharacterized protein LOC116164086 [Photinus pyralis]